jgi:hypothetical protein
MMIINATLFIPVRSNIVDESRTDAGDADD